MGNASHIVTFSCTDNLLFFVPLLASDEDLFLLGFMELYDEVLPLLEMGLVREVHVLFYVTSVSVHEGELLVLNVEELVLLFGDDGDGDVVASAESLFVLLVCENVLGDDHSLGGSVLAGFGGGHLSDLAGEHLLHHDEGAGRSAASLGNGGVGATRLVSFEFVVTHLKFVIY